MEKDELYYRLCLSKVDGIGPVKYKKLIEYVGNAKEIFNQKPKQLRSVYGLSEVNSLAIKNFKGFDLVEKEILFADKNNVQILEISNEKYPKRLRLCIDSPPILFYKGTIDLNHPKIISIIGTRMFTEYGRRSCEELIEGLKAYNVVVSSGLAFGIDAIAHKTCIKFDIPTIGVVAHGLDTMYPTSHWNLSKEMQLNGGLLTEYFSNTNADKGNFPSRNRIVAGMSDATIIIETDIKGGSMITAEIAYSYNRDVFCIPGRTSDNKSRGCNYLIQALKGQMISNAEDVAKSLGWDDTKTQKSKQRQLFIELSENEQTILELLKSNESMHIDEFYIKSILNNAELASSLLSLEMQNIIKVMPGKIVSLVD